MPKRLRATLLHIVYSKSKKIAIVFIIFLEKSITLSLSSRKRSIFNAFRHILPCVAPLCEDMHYHKTGVPWQIKSIFNIVFYLLVCSEILCFADIPEIINKLLFARQLPVNDKNSSKIKNRTIPVST